MSSNLLILLELLLVLGIVLGLAVFELASLRRSTPPRPDAEAARRSDKHPPETIERQDE